MTAIKRPIPKHSLNIPATEIIADILALPENDKPTIEIFKDGDTLEGFQIGGLSPTKARPDTSNFQYGGLIPTKARP